MPETIECINIDPTNPKESDLPILTKLLEDFRDNPDKKVLAKNAAPCPVTIDGKMYMVRLTYSISKPYAKPFQSDEFYVRSKALLGRGGFGFVKRALHRLKLQPSQYGNTISILPGLMVYKRMKRDVEGGQTYEQLKEIAEREIEILNKRYHLNIQLIEKENQKSVHFFAPFIPGKLLTYGDTIGNRYIITERSDIKKKLHFVRQQYAEINLMHTEKGFVHLDVKPDNIILDLEFGQLRHIDYGLGHDLNKNLHSLPGTPGYVDPFLFAHSEEWLDKGAETNFRYLTKGDIYSSGITSCEIITGTPLSQFSKVTKHVLDRELDSGFSVRMFDKGKAMALLNGSANGNKKLSTLLKGFIENVTHDSPDKRMHAEQAEMFMGLLNSQLFDHYLNPNSINFDFNKELSNADNLKKYSLMDLFYLVKYQTNFADYPFKADGILEILFPENDPQFKEKEPFTSAISKNKETIAAVYQEAIFKHFNDFATQMIHSYPNSNHSAINELIHFTKTNTGNYDDKKIRQFAELIDRILLDDIENKLDKINQSVPFSTKMVTLLDPLILEKISPALLTQASVLNTSFQNKMSQQLNDLANKLNTQNEKNKAINELIQFIRNNKNYNDENFKTLLAHIEEVINVSSEVQSKNSSAIIRILNLDPLILEQISPTLLEKANNTINKDTNFQRKMTAILIDFTDKLSKFPLAPKPDSIKLLIEFIEKNKNSFDNNKIKLLARLVENVILDFINNPLDQVKIGVPVPVITKIINLNPLILEQITPAILMNAQKINDHFQTQMANQLNHFATQLKNHVKDEDEDEDENKMKNKDGRAQAKIAKSQAIDELIQEMNTIGNNKNYNDQTFKKLADHLADVLSTSSKVQSKSVMGSSVITKVFNTVDNFLLNQVYGSVHQEALKFKSHTITHTITTFFHGFRKKGIISHKESESEGEGKVKGEKGEVKNPFRH